MECPGDNRLADYLMRQLSATEERAIDAHVAVCSSCRDALAAAGDLSAAPAPPPPRALGRYVLLRTIGAGGFGVVHAAYDQTLDRRVALKVLHAGAHAPPEALARLVREAQAMARLRSPHVVAVYDVVEMGGEVAIAMEFVEGESLREWLAEPRELALVVDRFEQAGRGLAAAHAAGIVHRDVKPANILVGSGRVAVTDFGLARLSSGGVEDPLRPPATLSAGPTTVAGAGTPAYMSPEQLAGQEVGPASDQFSFCVALYEALHREHPFDGATAVERAAAVRAGRRRPRPRRKSSVPRWLAHVLDRGLAVAPADRYPSMDALVAALSQKRRRTRLRLATVTAVAAVAIVTSAAWGTRRAAVCSGGEERARAVLAPAHRAAIERAFAASGVPYGDELARATWAGLERYLHDYAQRYGEVCRATRVRAEQPEAVMVTKLACLDRAQGEAAQLERLYESADAPAVRSAGAALPALSDLGACEDTAALLTQVAPTAGVAAAVAAERDALATARALRAVGRLSDARTMTSAVIEQARTLAYAPLLGEALLLDGQLRTLAQDPVGARDALEEALAQSARGRDDRGAAEAQLALVDLRGVLAGDPQIGLALGTFARAAIARLGGSQALAAKLDGMLGLLYAQQGRYGDALERQRAALEQLALAYGPDAAPVGPQLFRVAELDLELGRVAEAGSFATRSQALIAQALGEHHPLRALPETLLAEIACQSGAPRDCADRARRALVLRTGSATPPDSPALLPIWLVAARAETALGRADQALTTLARGASVARAAFGPDDAWLGRILALRGEALAKAGRAGEALATHARAVQVLAARNGIDHPDVATAREAWARTLHGLGRDPDALAQLVQVVAAREAQFGAGSPSLLGPLLLAGDCARGNAAKRGYYERAVRLAPAGSAEAVRAQEQLARLRG
jgi:hypothetical protein